MKKSKVSKIILMMVVVGIICCISGINHATSNLNDIIGGEDDKINDIPTIPGGSTPNPDEGNNTNTPTTPIGGNNTENTTKNITGNTNTTLPKAGANDTLLFGLIAISAVAAIYTYKKVRDYTA